MLQEMVANKYFLSTGLKLIYPQFNPVNDFLRISTAFSSKFVELSENLE